EGAVLDAPDPGLAHPAVERLAVEDRRAAGEDVARDRVRAAVLGRRAGVGLGRAAAAAARASTGTALAAAATRAGGRAGGVRLRGRAAGAALAAGAAGAAAGLFTAALAAGVAGRGHALTAAAGGDNAPGRQYRGSEEHTSELQSQSNLVCRLLLEK